MKVVMFGWEFPPFISGGLGTACFGLTRGLAEKNVEVVFVVPRMKGMSTTGHIRLVEAFNLDMDEKYIGETLEKFRVHPVDSFLMPYMTERSYIEYLRSLSQIMKEERSGVKTWQHYGPDLYSEVYRFACMAGMISIKEPCDVIHVHDWMTMPAGMYAKEQSGKPLVVHVHSLESDRNIMHMNGHIYAIERMGMMTADHVIAVSDYTKNKIIDEYHIPREKISVVHNAVSREESPTSFLIRRNSSKKYVLFLGRVTHQKGPDYFLKAAEIVHRRAPHVHFIIAGTGEMISYVKEQTLLLGLQKNIHFTGFLNGSLVERAYALSDLYVMPSVSEPFGISALEAIMCDIPVIISAQSGVGEVLRSCPKVDFWDVEELANTMIRILEDDGVREEIVRNCKEEIKDLSWKISGAQLVNVYRRLTGSP